MFRITSRLIVIATILLFAFAFWQRTTSLESLPDVNADEVWHAIQLTNFANGKPYKTWTLTDLPLSPIHCMLEIPFLLVLKPSLWMVRLPAFISGTLAVILTYVLGSRMFDRMTALIAAALMAILPLTIIYSRLSYEVSASPLFGIVSIYLAHRLRIKSLVVVMALCYFVHPTTIFMFPAVLGLVFARTLTETTVEPSQRVRLLVKREAPLIAVSAAMGLYTMLRPSTKQMSKSFDSGLWGRHNLLDFVSKIEHMFFGVDNSFPLRSWLFWIFMLLLFDFGLRQLIRTRKWDQVAIVLAPVVCALALFVMGGSNIIQPASLRYGLFLATPTILAVACLLQALLVEPTTPRRLALRQIEIAGMLVVGWSLLISFDLTRLTPWGFIPESNYRATESPWSFRSEAPVPAKQLHQIITKELGPIPASLQKDGGEAAKLPRTPVVAEIWWYYGTLEWLMSRRPDINVFDYHDLGYLRQPKVERLLASLRGGGYALCFPEGELDHLVRCHYPVAMRRHWEIIHPHKRFATLIRLNKVVSVPGDYDGDKKTEMAVYRTDTGEWLIPSLGPDPIRLGEPGRDVPVPGDYNGDGKTDIAVYRSETAEWFIPALGESPTRYGEPGLDVPIPGDYNGDGRTDLAVFRVLTCEWLIKCFGPKSHRMNDNGGFTQPVPADYDGDGRTDFAIFRTDTGQWLVPCLGPDPIAFGVPNRDAPVPHDYDGDGRADIAVYRQGSGEWFLRPSGGGNVQNSQFGVPVVDQPAPGDYDGDGKSEIAVYRTSTAEALVQIGKNGPMVTQLGPRGREKITDPARATLSNSPNPLTAKKSQGETKVK